MPDLPPRHFAPRPHLWGALTRDEIAEARADGALVVVPTGAVEQHAGHLGSETDSYLASAISELAAARTTARRVVVTPPVAYGFSPHHLSLPGTISLRLDTYLAVLRDVARSVLDSGFARVLFVNGHGGNIAPLRALIGEMVTDGHAVGMVDYLAPGLAAWTKHLQGALGQAGHACEHETALSLALAPDGMRDRIASAIRDLPPRLTQPWMAQGGDDPITRAGAGWPAIFQADDCGYFGDPGAATEETGRAILEDTVSALAEFYAAFAAAPLRLGIARDANLPRTAPVGPIGTDAP